MNRTRLKLLNRHLARNILRHQLVVKPLDDVWRPARASLSFGVRVLLNEFFDVEEAAADSDGDLVPLLNLDINPPLPKLINALGLAQKQYLQFVLFWILVDIPRQLLINFIRFVPNIHTVLVFQFANQLIGQLQLLPRLHMPYLSILQPSLIVFNNLPMGLRLLQARHLLHQLAIRLFLIV